MATEIFLEYGEIYISSDFQMHHDIFSVLSRKDGVDPFCEFYHSSNFMCTDIIDQTRGRVFSPISKHREVGWKNEAQPSFFNQLRGVWK